LLVSTFCVYILHLTRTDKDDAFGPYTYNMKTNYTEAAVNDLHLSLNQDVYTLLQRSIESRSIKRMPLMFNAIQYKNKF